MGAKRSTIAKILNKKISNWCNSIEDERIKRIIKNDVIITGGCITSLLLGEDINDYDCYFRNKESAFDVAQYYVDKFNEQNPYNPEDVAPVEPYIYVVEDRIRIMVKSAGITTEERDPYTYFEMQKEEVLDNYLDNFFKAKKQVGEKKAYRPIFISDNAITLSNDIQIIIRFYGNPEEIHKNFDFVHAFNYHVDGVTHLNPEALEAILSKTLVYKGSLYPIASVFRIRKFIERGWRITAGQILKILFQISHLDLEDLNVLYDQLVGVDVAYMQQLLSMIKKNGKIDEAYLVKIIDETFE